MKKQKCEWCLKHSIRNPEWEQKGLDGKWKPLCSYCARRRLNNPYNALLDMRKIASPTPKQDKHIEVWAGSHCPKCKERLFTTIIHKCQSLQKEGWEDRIRRIVYENYPTVEEAEYGVQEILFILATERQKVEEMIPVEEIERITAQLGVSVYGLSWESQGRRDYEVLKKFLSKLRTTQGGKDE